MKKKAVAAASRIEPSDWIRRSSSGGSVYLATTISAASSRGGEAGSRTQRRHGRRTLDAVLVRAGRDNRDLGEVVGRHRRRQLPLERARVPRVRGGGLADEDERPNQVVEDDQQRAAKHERGR